MNAQINSYVEAADFLRVSVSSIKRFIANGTLRVEKRGAYRVSFERSELEKFAKARQAKEYGWKSGGK